MLPSAPSTHRLCVPLQTGATARPFLCNTFCSHCTFIYLPPSFALLSSLCSYLPPSPPPTVTDSLSSRLPPWTALALKRPSPGPPAMRWHVASLELVSLQLMQHLRGADVLLCRQEEASAFDRDSTHSHQPQSTAKGCAHTACAKQYCRRNA